MAQSPYWPAILVPIRLYSVQVGSSVMMPMGPVSLALAISEVAAAVLSLSRWCRTRIVVVTATAMIASSAIPIRAGRRRPLRFPGGGVPGAVAFG